MSGVCPDPDRLDSDLSDPAPDDVALMARLEGDLLILGVGGKMGPTLARLAVRASDAAGVHRHVIGVSRFGEGQVRTQLESWGVETVQADLLSEDDIAALPEAANVIFMAGQKFGTTGSPSDTWAANAYMPALVARRFPRSRIVVFSSGNVYPFTDAAGPGTRETDPPAPVGEYAQSVLGRERLFEHFSRRAGTPVAIVRLNYAIEPRYGVLRDIADRVVAGRPVDLAVARVNVIWQRDANSIALRLLERCASPPFVLNVTGRECLSVKELAKRFGVLLGVEPAFRGEEQRTALLSDSSICHSIFGPPLVTVDEMVSRVADWVRRGGPGLGRPTHFEKRDGRF